MRVSAAGSIQGCMPPPPPPPPEVDCDAWPLVDGRLAEGVATDGADGVCTEGTEGADGVCTCGTCGTGTDASGVCGSCVGVCSCGTDTLSTPAVSSPIAGPAVGTSAATATALTSEARRLLSLFPANSYPPGLFQYPG